MTFACIGSLHSGSLGVQTDSVIPQVLKSKSSLLSLWAAEGGQLIVLRQAQQSSCKQAWLFMAQQNAPGP